jgi:hypothetical protein
MRKVMNAIPAEGQGRVSEQALKQQYLHCLAAILVETATLRSVVAGLVSLGATRRDLLCWAAEAGHHAGYVRTLLSKILCDLGLRSRKAGAGPKTPPEALLILASARNQYGDNALKFLRAACRAANAERQAPAKAA